MGKLADSIRKRGKMGGKKKKKTSFLGFLKKWSVVVLFLLYLFVGAMGTNTWAKAMRFRSLGEEELVNRISFYRKTHDFKTALFTIEAQKPERAQEMVDMLLPRINDLEPPFYLALAKQYALLENMEDATFWTMLGSFRLRVDDFMCEGWKSFRASETYYGLKRDMSVIDYIVADKERAMKIFHRMLEWDRKNPPWIRGDVYKLTPEYFCRQSKRLVYAYKLDDSYTGKTIPVENWQLKYAILRALTKKYFADELDGNFSWKTVFEKEGLNEVPTAMGTVPNQTPIPEGWLQEQLKTSVLQKSMEDNTPVQTDDEPEQAEEAE